MVFAASGAALIATALPHLVTFLDCAGINVLLAIRRQLRPEGGWIRVVQASASAYRTISLLGLADLLMPDGC